MRRIKLFSLIQERVAQRMFQSRWSTRRRASWPLSITTESLETRCLLSAGDLDPTFGVRGAVDTLFNIATTFTSSGFNAVTQPDGRIIVAGTLSPINLSQPFTVEIVQHNSNGSLDTTFGASRAGFTNLVLSSADQLTLQADRKIIVSSAAKLARLNENGTLDTLFGTAGIATAPFSGACYGTTVRRDGQILLLLGSTSQTTQGTTRGRSSLGLASSPEFDWHTRPRAPRDEPHASRHSRCLKSCCLASTASQLIPVGVKNVEL